MIKVCWIDTHGELFGGGQQSMLEAVTRLPLDRIEPIVICGSEGNLVEAMRAEGVKVHVLPIPTLKRSFGQQKQATQDLKRLLEQEKVDLIHANSMRATLYALKVAKDIPVISHVRVMRGSSLLDFLLDQWIAAKSSLIIANSNKVAERFRWCIKKPKLKVLYNAIEIEPYDQPQPEDLRFQWGLPMDVPLVGLVGMLDPRKGHTVLLESFSKIHRKTHCELVIAGREPVGSSGYRQQLEQRVKDLGLEGKVHFLGHVRNVPVLMKLLDVCVLPVVEPEGFGRVIIEAFAARRPVIASDLGAISEIISHEENGLLCPAGDVEALSESLLRLIQDPMLCKELGEAGRMRVELHFDLKTKLARLASIYEELKGNL